VELFLDKESIYGGRGNHYLQHSNLLGKIVTNFAMIVNKLTGILASNEIQVFATVAWLLWL
jgi:hypothetical protein